MVTSLTAFSTQLIGKTMAIVVATTVLTTVIATTVAIAVILTRPPGKNTLVTSQSFLKVAVSRLIIKDYELWRFADEQKTFDKFSEAVARTLERYFSPKFVKIIFSDFTQRPVPVLENNVSSSSTEGEPSLVSIDGTAYFTANYTATDIRNAMSNFSQWIVLLTVFKNSSGALANISLAFSIFTDTEPSHYTVGHVLTLPQYNISDDADTSTESIVPTPAQNKTSVTTTMIHNTTVTTTTMYPTTSSTSENNTTNTTTYATVTTTSLYLTTSSTSENNTTNTTTYTTDTTTTMYLATSSTSENNTTNTTTYTTVTTTISTYGNNMSFTSYYDTSTSTNLTTNPGISTGFNSITTSISVPTNGTNTSCSWITAVNFTIILKRPLTNAETLNFYNATATFQDLSAGLTTIAVSYSSATFIKTVITNISAPILAIFNGNDIAAAIYIYGHMYFSSHCIINSNILNALESYTPVITLKTSTGGASSGGTTTYNPTLAVGCLHQLTEETSRFYMCFPIISSALNQINNSTNASNLCQSFFRADINIQIELFVDYSLIMNGNHYVYDIYVTFSQSMTEYLISSYPQSLVSFYITNISLTSDSVNGNGSSNISQHATCLLNIVGSIYFVDSYTSNEIMATLEYYAPKIFIATSNGTLAVVYGILSSVNSYSTNAILSTLSFYGSSVFTCVSITSQ